jgi:hypothetical protein
VVPIPVPDQVQPGARPELDELERPLAEREERRQQRPAALHLVRLHTALGDEAPQPLALARERLAHVPPLPPRDALLEHEVVQPAEQPHRQIPAVVGRDLARQRVVRQPAAEIRIQRRAGPLAGLGL